MASQVAPLIMYAVLPVPPSGPKAMLVVDRVGQSGEVWWVHALIVFVAVLAVFEAIA
ncbi:MAG: hypothetical protein ACLP8S_10565 [Solirubrobacteraceae bacterium]